MLLKLCNVRQLSVWFVKEPIQDWKISFMNKFVLARSFWGWRTKKSHSKRGRMVCFLEDEENLIEPKGRTIYDQARQVSHQRTARSLPCSLVPCGVYRSPCSSDWRPSSPLRMDHYNYRSWHVTVVPLLSAD